MNKKILAFCLTFLLAAGINIPARAETSYGGNGWRVAFTDANDMVSNFKTAELDDKVSGMQPGDNIIFTIALQNENSETTDWWMTNKVLRSLEDTSANSATHGGAYTYILTYKDKEGAEITLFSSETVGGEGKSSAGEGLHGATNALEDFFYLDTLATGQSGTITLEVALDGETQGNDYQDTLADLQMNFAVELTTEDSRFRSLRGFTSNFLQRTRTTDGQYELINLNTTGSGRRGNAVRTGDDRNTTPYLVIMTISGVCLLALAIYSRKRGKEEKEAESNESVQ